jgi:hypothetical protein
MNATSRFPKVFSLCLLLFPLLVASAWAQLEIRPVSRFNATTDARSTLGTSTQFSSVGVTSGGVNTGNAAPNDAGPFEAKAEYKNAQQVVTSTLVLTTAQIGNSFSNGVPRYYLGDVITPPLTKADNTAAPAGYWRAMPVRALRALAPGNTTTFFWISQAPQIGRSTRSGRRSKVPTTW